MLNILVGGFTGAPLGFVEIEIPALSALLAAVAAAIVWVVAEGVLGVYRRQVRFIVLGLAHQIARVKVPWVGVHPFTKLADLIGAAYYTLDRLIAQVATDSGNAAAVLFKFFLDLHIWLAKEIAELAADTYHALQRTSTLTVTKVQKITGPTIIKPIRNKIVYVTKTSAAALTRLNRRVTKLEKRLAHLPKALVPAVGFPMPRGKKLEAGLHHFEKRVTNQGKRITRLEKKVFSGTGGALIIAGLTALGMEWIKCKSARDVGRRLRCGSFDFLRSLLSLALDALIITNLCTVTELLTRIANEFQPVLTRFTSGIVDLMDCQGTSRPPNLNVNAVELPPVTPSSIAL